MRSRLFVRGCMQVITHIDDTYDSTPVLLILKVLLVYALAVGRGIFTYDVKAAFLHATLDPNTEPMHVWAPEEYDPEHKTTWRLKKPAYGLRTAARAWQDHFADELMNRGLKRLKSDSNVYIHQTRQIVVLAYVDGLMVFGKPEDAQDMDAKLKVTFLIRSTGDLNTKDYKLRFLRRTLQRANMGGMMFDAREYYEPTLDERGLEQCKEAKPVALDGSGPPRRNLPSWTRSKTARHQITQRLQQLRHNHCGE